MQMFKRKWNEEQCEATLNGWILLATRQRMKAIFKWPFNVESKPRYFVKNKKSYHLTGPLYYHFIHYID